MACAEGDGRIDRQRQAAHLAGSHAVPETTDTDAVDRYNLWWRIRAALPGRLSRVARRSPLLLVSSSVAALLVGGGAPPALAAPCAISPVTNQSSVGNSGSIDCVSVSGITVTGNVTNTNTGTIAPTALTQAGIAVDNSSIGGTISNSGTITTARSVSGIAVAGGGTVSGGIVNSGTITVGDRGISVSNVSTFAGGVSNSGTISAGLQGIFVYGVSTLAGGISNSGTISAGNSGISVQQVSTFAGGITNSSTISSANRTGISVEQVSTFAGGITNSGTITAGRTGIAAFLVSTFLGGITNSGTISANGTGILAVVGSSFAGGISNSGTISAGNSGIRVNFSSFAGGIANSGKISSANGTGINIKHGSTFAGGIVNSGMITAGNNGISVNVSSFAGGIVNSGRISAGSSGIFVVGGSSFAGGISNAGTISAGRMGVYVHGVSSFAGGISNSGAISVGAYSGIYVTGVSSFAGGINNSGTISAGANGIVVNDSIFAGGISNSGTISGPDYGIFVYSTSTFSGGISNSGTISAGANTGIWVVAVSSFAGGIRNSGTISAAAGTGISVSSVSTFTGGISNSGTISAAQSGISVTGVLAFAGGVANSGTISAASTGIYVNASSFGDGISNSGTISARGGGGIYVPGGSTFAGGISNSGRISTAASTAAGIYVGDVSAFAGGINNSGTIAAAATGIAVSSVSTFAGGITNTGTISGVSGIVVSGSGPVSVFDSGTIVGTGGTAVKLSGNAVGNSFTLGPGYRITGNVLGAGSDTLQLGGSGSGAFNLGSIGSGQQYQGFTTFNVVSGTWTASGAFGQSQTWNVNGGTLAGTGMFAGINVNSGGTLQPGAAMTIHGNLAFGSGAVYLVQVNPTTTSLANVSGTATLTGGIVNAQLAFGSHASERYTILTAAGGFGGTTFAGLTNTNLPAGASESLSYDSHDVYLKLTAGFTNYTWLSRNQQQVANTLTNYFNSTGGIPAAFFGLSRSGLTQVDGEVATAAEHGAFQLMTDFLGLMLDPTAGGGGATGASAAGFAEEPQRVPPDVARAYATALEAPAAASFDQRWRAWGAGFGGSSQTNGDPAVGSSNVTASAYGYAAGSDYRVTPDTLLGFALAGGGTNWSLAQGLGTGRSDAFQAGLYGKSYFGPVYLSGALAFANNWFTTNRVALGDQLTANFTGQSYAARGEAGYRYGLPITGAIVGITPYAALQVQDFRTPSYSETDLTGGGLGLGYGAVNAIDTRSELGARFDNLQIVAGMPLVLRGRLAWAHDWVSNPSQSAVFESLPGTGFIVSGAPIPKNSALSSVGAELKIDTDWSLMAKFDGEFASGSQTYAGTGTLRYTW